MERKNRNHAFDLLCGVCIVRMLVLHIMTFCGHAQDAWWQQVMAWTYYFMCFFFFKSGYFNRSVGGPTGAYLKGKTLRLLVPYLTAGLIGDAVYFSLMPFLIQRYHHPVEPLSWSHIWEEGQFYGNGPVWFLCTFYFTYVGVHFIEKVRHLRYAFFLFPAVSWWLSTLGNPLWLGLDNLFMGFFCFYLGHFWHRLTVLLGRRRTFALSVLLLGCFCMVNAWSDTYYAMSSNTFRGQLPLLVSGMSCALCGLTGLLMALEVPRVPVIDFIGRHSMVYFISHYPILYIYKFVHLSFGRSIYGRYDDVILLIPIVFIICTWLVPYVERVPWLSGRWNNMSAPCQKTPLSTLPS